uniref:Putative secreted protein n=1 Tax=Anopheles darlingi TaxID=43151 RepID=A0A2M4D6N2_ANODA
MILFLFLLFSVCDSVGLGFDYMLHTHTHTHTHAHLQSHFGTLFSRTLACAAGMQLFSFEIRPTVEDQLASGESGTRSDKTLDYPCVPTPAHFAQLPPPPPPAGRTLSLLIGCWRANLSWYVTVPHTLTDCFAILPSKDRSRYDGKQRSC